MRLAYYNEQQVKGLCTLCDEPRAPGSKCHCPEHQAAHRKAQREWISRKRKWWRFNHDCIYCNGKRKAIEVSPGKWLRYCAACAELQAERKQR